MAKFFKISERGSNVKTEIIAGLTTFFAMAYIIIVNPNQVVGFSFDVPGVPKIWNAAYIASILVAVVGTLLMGLYAKMPFAQACGMGLNSFFFVSFILNGVPAILVVLGGQAAGEMLAKMPVWIMDGFALVGGILPALGVGMLLNFMGQKKILPFFFLGFFLAQYLGLGTMAITVFGTIIAFIIYLFGENKDKEVA